MIFEKNKCSVCGRKRINGIGGYKWLSHFEWKTLNGDLLLEFNICPKCREENTFNEILLKLSMGVKEK